MKRVLLVLLVLGLFAGGGPSFAALNPNSPYTINIYKMNSDGTTSLFSTSEGTTDGNGKLSFSLTSLPTTADANFIVLEIKDENDAVARKGFVPAPPAGSTNLMGVNDLSTAQTNAILTAVGIIGTDDPIAVAYLLVLIRSSSAADNDAQILAQLGKQAITGSSGFEGFLLNNGVPASKLAAFKNKLIYNGIAGKKTIADLTAAFKTAVDSGNTTTAQQEMQKAGGFMADIFMDAAEASGIDFTLILAAHDAAGVVADGLSSLIAQLSSTVRNSMESSMSAFFQRIAAVKVKSEYTAALNTLNASGTQVTSYINAVNTMMDTMAGIDSTYSGFYGDPDAYCAVHGTTLAAVRNLMNTAYQNAFTTFQNSITSSDSDITTMKANVVTAMKTQNSNFQAAYLGSDFGTYRDFTGTQKNWPIPQAVMVNWLAFLITAGGTLTYTRDTIDIPTTMQSWYNSTGCTSTNGTWTAGRCVRETPSPAFNAYLGLQDDIQIIENARYANYSSGQPTKEQEKAFRLLFQQRMDAAAGRISGTTNGTTAISTAQKDAIIKLLMQPSMD